MFFSKQQQSFVVVNMNSLLFYQKKQVNHGMKLMQKQQKQLIF